MPASKCLSIVISTHTSICMCMQALRDDVLALGEVIGETATSDTPSADGSDPTCGDNAGGEGVAS